jgi:hypothetical protein
VIDRLGVLQSTARVVERAELVSIDDVAVDAAAERLASLRVEPPAWRVWPHWWDDSERTANYVLVLDALNFSFWRDPKWRVEHEGRALDGYWALAACLRRAIGDGVPILDADYLAGIDGDRARHFFRGHGEIPMLEQRVANLREIGVGLQAHGGSFARVVEAARGDGVALVRAVVRLFPSFDDVATYRDRAVRFYKRAQILVSDLHGAYAGERWGRFEDLDQLTAFADYKLPQVLRELGLLVYERRLAEQIDRQIEIPAGSPAEVEIRAATIWACEKLRRSLNRARARFGPDLPPLRSFEVDWYLWDYAQGRDLARPYHRTRTLFY